jgi:hypothetical protein
MIFTLKSLSCFVASAAILLGTSTLIAAKRPAPSARSVGSAELEMQVLLDRADFSPGEIDRKSKKNSARPSGVPGRAWACSRCTEPQGC